MTYLCSDENGNVTVDGFHCTKIKVRKYANAIKAPVETGQMSFDNKVIMPNEIQLTGYVDAISSIDAMKTEQILAEMIASYFAKGREIIVHGEMNNNPYEKDGVKVSWWQIKVNGVDFCGKKEDNGQAQAQPSVPDGFEPINEDEIPF